MEIETVVVGKWLRWESSGMENDCGWNGFSYETVNIFRYSKKIPVIIYFNFRKVLEFRFLNPSLLSSFSIINPFLSKELPVK
jgi:hypothetical protein